MSMSLLLLKNWVLIVGNIGMMFCFDLSVLVVVKVGDIEDEIFNGSEIEELCLLLLVVVIC